MASSKKRHHLDNDNKEHVPKEGNGSESITKNTATRKPRKTRLKRTKISENLLMKLPGELRNAIYELALIKDDIVQIRQPHQRPRYHDDKQSKPKRWREPGLLRVSKAARKEASSIYYSNQFEIYLNPSMLEQVCAWIKQKQESSAFDQGEGELFSFESKFTSANYKTLKSWITLAKLFYDLTQFGPDYEDCRKFYENMVSDNFLRGAHGKMREVALLGVRAKLRGLHYKELKTDFEEWAISQISARNSTDVDSDSDA